MSLLNCWVILLLLVTQDCLAFQGALRPFSKVSSTRTQGPSTFALSQNPRPLASSSKLFFFGRKNAKDKEEIVEEPPSPVATTTEIEEVPLAPPSPPQEDIKPSKQEDLSPQERAAKLRADAERARLEAQRMDAELTLRKIEALEKKVKKKKDKPASDDEDGSNKLQEEINRLSQKFKEQTANPPVKESNGASTSTPKPSVSSTPPPTTDYATDGVVWPKFIESYSDADSAETIEEINNALKFVPNFIKMIIVSDTSRWMEYNQTAVDPGDKLTQALERILRGDLGIFDFEEPRFTQTELDQAKEKVKGFLEISNPLLLESKDKKNAQELFKMVNSMEFLSDGKKPDTVDIDDQDSIATFLWASAASNKPDASLEDLTRLWLEYTYYVKKATDSFLDEDDITEETFEGVLKAASEEWYLKPLFRGQGDGNTTLVSFMDNIIDSLFPKSTTQLKNENPVLPPQAQVDRLASEVLPQTLFRATSRPQPVLGGFVIKGSSIPENDDQYGDKVIQSINEQLSQRKYAAISDVMTISYVPDFMYLEEAEGEVFFTDGEPNPPLLYICGPNVARSSRPVQLSIVSAIGLATTWYLSLYPFLLNRGIAGRVDEELAMIDAGVMAPNLSWLTELSLPLFITFCSIQVLHEVAHAAVAKLNGIKTFPPTLVPSILTGITSSVTSLKTPPKNLNAMFDFSIAGPLTGMIASAFALVWGSQLTGMMDTATFPALPLEILRQSTLGGGIINNVIGEGVLNVPTSALGTPAVAEMTVALHPLAVAGYLGLVLNALSLLPIGTTDGGRVALTVFGRQAKSGIGSFALAVLLWFGIAGSDLFLYYFSFCIAFQSGNEIPAQNEVDRLSLPRVFLAVLSYVIAALALIPFQ